MQKFKNIEPLGHAQTSEKHKINSLGLYGLITSFTHKDKYIVASTKSNHAIPMS